VLPTGPTEQQVRAAQRAGGRSRTDVCGRASRRTTHVRACGRPSRRTLVGLATVVALGACAPDGGERGGDGGADGASPGVVNVYSHRHYDTDRELFRRFTAETGIEVQVVTASADELITRLRNEGAASPADVLITVDAGRLDRAAQEGLLQPVHTEALETNVPARFRDPSGHWYGLTQRARVLVYHRDRVDPSRLGGYESLASPEWRGRVLVRSSSNVYNQSLLAGLIARHGPEAAERWAAGVVRNLARAPRGGDTDQLKLVAAGVGDVALVNTYYLARLAESSDPEDRRAAERLAVHFPDQAGAGTHVNVSGAGVTRSSRNVANATRLLEYLTGDEAQLLFAASNQEYPVKPGVPWSPALEAWGDFRGDTLDLARLGELNGEAVRMFDRVGWR
jgi:iron(III) transport system substrate-binding protein